MALKSNISNIVFSINKLFDLIEDNKACIYSSKESTYIKWNEDNTKFTKEQIDSIKEDFLSYPSTCSSGSGPGNTTTQ